MSADQSIAAAAVLADGLRWRMYSYIRQAGAPVTRDEAAAAAGISRKLAAFHLDKLVAAGLLRPGYARPGGLRRVGRAPKVYQPAGVDVRVSIPPREHELLASILLDAVLAEDGREPASRAALRIAGDRGRALGEQERARTRPGRLGAERALTIAEDFARSAGFEPTRPSPTLVRLRNCPFHPLADQARDLVCGINLAFLRGFLDGLGASAAMASLNPQPGACCVELHAAGQADPATAGAPVAH